MWTHIFDVFIRHAFLHDKPKNIKDMDNFPYQKGERDLEQNGK